MGKPAHSPKARREALAGYLFLTPSLIAFLAFVIAPLVYIVYLSFTKYNVIQPPQLNELKNWIRLSTDRRFVTTLLNSLKFLALLVPMHMLMGLLLALAAASVKNRFAVYSVRTVVYFPTLLTTSSVAMAWTFMLSTDLGFVNYYLSKLGIPNIPWLNSSFWVYPSTMLFSLWKFVGLYFLYFFIGLQGIDRSLTEAADIDGASGFQKLRHITLPLLSPTIFFVLTILLIGCVQIFEEPYMLTGGGPGDASRSLSLYIYESAYISHNFGYASAMALVLLLVVLLLTLLQFRGSGMWVNYDRE